MRGPYNHIALFLILALMLSGWPFPAHAQGCYIAGNGDYICDGYQARPRAAPQPDRMPTYSPTQSWASRDTSSAIAEMIALSRTLQDSLAEAREAGAAAFAPSGECTFVPDGSSGPQVTGQTFTVSNSSELQAAIRKAKSGDAVVLKNGKYTGPLVTRAPGVTFMAENPHGVTITAGNGQHMAEINHDGTVISGIVFEGNKKSRGLKVRASNALVQNNIIRDTINTAIKVGDTREYGTISNITVTGNLIDGTGWELFGEGMYIGTDPFHSLKNSRVENISIYNNVLRGFTENGIDIKPNVTNADIHHNILENQVTMMERGRGKVVKHPSGGANRPGDKNFGPVVLSGVNANFHDNILRNMSANNTLLDIKQNAGNIVSGNSFNGTGALGTAIKTKGSGGGGQSRVTADNTFCNIGSTKTQTSGGLAVQASMSSAASACQANEQRILSEMKNLPSGGGSWDCSGGGDTATKQVAPGTLQPASAGGDAAAAAPSPSQSQGSSISPSGAPLASCTAPTGSGKTYYVSPSGSDSGPGTAAQPFRTIQKAVNMAKPGDTVIVKDGTYTSTGQFGVHVKNSGREDAWITIRAENKWGAIIDGGNKNGHSGIRLGEGVHHVRIENFDIQRWNSGGITTSENVHDIYFSGNNIHHIGNICTDTQYGIVGFSAKKSTYNLTYDSNVIHDIGRLRPNEKGCKPSTIYYKNHDHGIYAHGRDYKIINNIFYNNDNGWDMQPGPGASGWLASNNTFASANPDRDGQFLLWNEQTNHRIENNIFEVVEEFGCSTSPVV